MGVARAGLAGVAGSALGLAAVLTGQALHATRRTDLPTVVGLDPSGCEGLDHGPVVRVAAVGDSTLTGPGLDDPADVWIRQALRAEAEHRRLELTSFAAGGSRVRDVVRDQLEPVLDHRPDLVVVAVGTNDAVHFTPLGAVRHHTEVLVARLARHVPHVVMGGVGDLANIQRIGWPLAGALRRRGHLVDAVIREVVAGRENVHYVKVSDADHVFRRGGRSLCSPDLFHPNRDGHAVWAGVAAPALRAALQRLESSSSGPCPSAAEQAP